MALFKFTQAILAGRTIDVYGQGQLVRDFTYIDDIVEGVLRVLDKPATPDPAFDPQAPHPAAARHLPGVQHRQQPAHGADGLHRRHRGRAGRCRPAKRLLPVSPAT